MNIEKSIAITGISSFVGANLAIKFIREGFNVIGIISNSIETYSKPRIQRLNICMKQGVKLYKLDLKNKEEIEIFFIKNKKIDYFIHHAAWVKDANSLNFDLNKAISLNIIPLRKLYEELSIIGSKGIIITGTNAEYGVTNNGSKETDNCIPATPYGLSKLCMTITSHQLSKEFKMPTRVARIFNPLGALDNPKKLLPSFIHQINANKIFNLSSCIQKRDFIYIEDLMDGYYKLVEDLTKKGFDIFNLCTGEAIELKELLIIIASAMGKEMELLNFGALEMRAGEPLISYGNNEKALKILGWNPESVRNKIEKIVFEILNEND